MQIPEREYVSMDLNHKMGANSSHPNLLGSTSSFPSGGHNIWLLRSISRQSSSEEAKNRSRKNSPSSFLCKYFKFCNEKKIISLNKKMHT